MERRTPGSSWSVAPLDRRLDGLFGVEQECDHLLGPYLAEVLDDAVELSEMMGVAQGVDDVIATVGLPAVVDGGAGHLAMTPMSSMASAAALVAAQEGVERAEATWTQCKDPSTRARSRRSDRGASHSRSVTTETNSPRAPPAWATMEVIAPPRRGCPHVGEDLGQAVIGKVLVEREVDGERPDAGPITGRSDRLWRCGRLGLAPAGARRRSMRCSVTKALTSGSSKTWRRSTPTTSASERSAPQLVQDRGAASPRRRDRRPGPGTCLPSRAACPDAAWRSPLGPVAIGGLVSASAEGGIEELRGLRPSRSLSLAISASSSPICALCCPVSNRNAATSSFSSS